MDAPDRTDTVHQEFVPWEVIDRGWPFRAGKGPVLVAVLALVVVVGAGALVNWWPARTPQDAPPGTLAEIPRVTTTVLNALEQPGLLTISEADLLGLAPAEDSQRASVAAEEAVRRYFTVNGPDARADGAVLVYPEWVSVVETRATESGWSVRLRCSLLAGSSALTRLAPLSVDVEVQLVGDGFVAGVPTMVMDAARSVGVGVVDGLVPVPPEVGSRAVAVASPWGTAEILGGREDPDGWWVLVSINGLPAIGITVPAP
ncbi:MAG: hypothetical protein OEO77_10230 [Acidimicrobiia bacterium]|nr:hypothetical protein [Acidimicrobiia bacterium]